jgi:hypothetical protein
MTADARVTHLQRVTAMVDQLERTTDALRGEITRARKAGATWADIGQATGTTRQAAQQRWSKDPT